MTQEEYNREDERLKAAYLAAKASGKDLSIRQSIRDLGDFYASYDYDGSPKGEYK